jgi:hypothetical protein
LWQWLPSLTIVINVTCAFRITAMSAVLGSGLAWSFLSTKKILEVRGKDCVLRCGAAKARMPEDVAAGVFAENAAWSIALSPSTPSA